MTSRVTILITALIFFVLGAVCSYVYLSNKVNTIKDATTNSINNCEEAVRASFDIAQSCGAAYSTASACVANLRTCNIAETALELQEHNEQREEAEARFKKIIEEAGFTVTEKNK